MNVSTVIVTYNALRNNWLCTCLDSLQHSTLSSKVIIVDNNSKDDTCRIVKEKYPHVILIENHENSGFGKANNIGIEIALKNNADYVFLLNQDAWVEKETIQKLVLKLSQNPEFGIISPIHLNGKGNALDYNFSNNINPRNCKNLYSDYVLNQVFDKVYESAFICAAAWLISKKCLEKVGGFNPTFFHYGEDDNYVHRLHYNGLKIGVDPFSTIYHDREERENNDYQKQTKTAERDLLLKYSDPNKSNDLQREKKRLKTILVKSKLFNQTDTITYVRNKIAMIDQHAEQITKNLNTSKSGQSFIFLNLDFN